MPAFVLHAQDSADDGAVAGLVRQLYAGQEAHGTRCAVAQDAYDGGTEVRRAAGMVRALSDPKKWGGPKAVYRRYAFPRLRLVHAIDDAVAELGDSWPAPAQGSPETGQDQRQQLLDQLARQRWRPKGRGRWSPGLQLSDMAHILPASIVAGLAALPRPH
ncbi:hypothetical protein [Streptomyces sp. V4I8]|uniref:hypothetical protein n=1 Tax=Streptomyces sp. V4I8 TaxID=3156469 RepID=UPI0035125EF8